MTKTESLTERSLYKIFKRTQKEFRGVKVAAVIFFNVFIIFFYHTGNIVGDRQPIFIAREKRWTTGGLRGPISSGGPR